jgi:hypothetical protein
VVVVGNLRAKRLCGPTTKSEILPLPSQPVLVVLETELKTLYVTDSYDEQDFEAIPKDVLLAGSRACYDYTVGLTFEGKLAGSGTLVRQGSVFGILTAWHVVRVFQARGKEHTPIGLIISDRDHSFGFERTEILSREERLAIHVIGQQPDETKSADGPDLAFMQIRDPSKLATISAFKSFYPLDLRTFQPYAELKKLLMFVAGSPAKLAAEIEPGLTQSIIFVPLVQVVSETKRNDFDYVHVGVRADESPFPSTYGGVSGGGLWHVPLCRNASVPGNPFLYENPILAGVAFFEIDKSPHIDLVCHGPESVYTMTRSFIAALG